MADPDPGGGNGGRERADAERASDREEDEEDTDPVELGVALLARLEHAELSVADAIDRIEAITTVPALQREILETAERRGVLDRDGTVLRPQQGGFVRFERDVVQRDGEFSCQRCGADLSTGHFIRLEPGDVGPFGSSCIRKVTGRE